ncbi:hypothetical protein JKF63_02021 [Porcisia hertigi]|uniref:Centrosomal protein CEP104 N-terminal domain-containing protein n=1 Tax=Porcisia hertigi TaxID=2761500 RepID=A0A836HLI9_9TRYP|nr:hypothetical protein JKF63_02021 [Porcisia hertigi]
MSVGLPYDVLFCTSEDPQHPISELGGCNGIIKPGSSTPAGWQSACHGKTPQTLVIRFQGNVWLQQLRILSHEAKIATKVEVRVAKLSQEDDWNNPPSFRNVRFVKLGSVDFNSNEQSHFKSKERKTVHLKTEAYFLKLLFDRPFINAYNTGHQVGIYSLECSGYLIEPILFHADPPPSGGTALEHTGASQPPVKRAAPKRQASRLPSDLVSHENQRANRAQKADTDNGQPVSAPVMSPPPPSQWYQSDMAPSRAAPATVYRSVRILEFEDFFVHRSEELVSLKAEAVAVEDYRIAVECRDKLALLNSRAREIYELEGDKVQAILDEDFEVAEQLKIRMNALMEQLFTQLSLPSLAAATPSAHNDDQSPVATSCPGYTVRSSPSTEHLASRPYSSEVAEDREPRASDAIEPNEVAEKMIDVDALDSREQAIAQAILSCADSEEVTCVELSNPGFDIQPLINALGIFTAACLLSRRFKLREASLIVLTESIDMFQSPANTIEIALLRFLDMNGYGIQDPIPNVVFAACRFVSMCLTSSSRRTADVLLPLTALLPRLVTRCSDNLQRVRDEAMTTMMLYVKTSSVPSSSILSVALMEPTDRERRNLPISNAKAQLARLNLLQLLVENGRLHLESGVVHSKHVLHKLLLPTVNHPNSEVRDLAVSILGKLVAGRHLAIRDKDLAKIHHAGIRDSIARKR